MSKVLYIISLIFLIIWLAGFFFYSLGAAVHILLLIAFIAIILRINMRRVFARNRRQGKDVSVR